MTLVKKKKKKESPSHSQSTHDEASISRRD